MHSLFPDDDRTRFSRNLAVGCAAGGLVMGATNPLWVAKTRLCLQYEGRRRRYAGLADCLARLWREEGLRGLYKGLVPGLLGTVNGAVQFALYNFLKHERNALAGDSFDAPLVGREGEGEPRRVFRARAGTCSSRPAPRSWPPCSPSPTKCCVPGCRWVSTL